MIIVAVEMFTAVPHIVMLQLNHDLLSLNYHLLVKLRRTLPLEFVLISVSIQSSILCSVPITYPH